MLAVNIAIIQGEWGWGTRVVKVFQNFKGIKAVQLKGTFFFLTEWYIYFDF